ncbi:MAG: hypothetical protein ACFFFH_17615 [Candidatus Thorarchaeota archaeon]
MRIIKLAKRLLLCELNIYSALLGGQSSAIRQIPSIGADRLSWREMHIRVIVLSYLLEKYNNIQ